MLVWRSRNVARIAALAVLIVTALGVGAMAEEGRGITIEDAVRMALDNDLTAQIAKLSFEAAQVNYQKNLASNLLTDSTVNALTAESNLRNAQIAYENQQGSVIASTVSTYFDVLADEITVGIRKAQLRIAEINLESTLRRANLGTASQLDVLDAQANAQTSRLSLQSAESALRQRKENLAASLGLSSADAVVLVADVEAPRSEFSLEDGIAAALARNASILSARTELEVARIDLERAEADGVAPLDLKLAQIAVQREELELQQALRSARNNVISAYQAVMTAADNLRVQESRLEAAEQRYQVILQQYAAGLRTETEQISAEVTLAQAKLDHLNTLASYIEAVLAYRHLIGAPDVSGANDGSEA